MADMKIALAGNPNSGKTTLFNELTGSNQYVGNWPGVTVEKKEGKLRGNKDIIIQDLPGVYSLSPYTLEEVVSRNYLIQEKPDVILNIVDGSNLERNLYLTTQLCEIGVPMIIAINMMDIVEKNGDHIDIKKLSKAFDCPVVELSALKKVGTKEAAQAAIDAGRSKKHPTVVEFSPAVEDALKKISLILQSKCEERFLRWYSIKAIENDQEAMKQLSISTKEQTEITAIVDALELAQDDDSESIITGERYTFISTVIQGSTKRKNIGQLTTSDKIDRIVTNRWLALPIFALVMWAVYFLSISTVGTLGTDWVNDTLFGEWIPNALGGFLERIGTAPWLMGLIMDGIVAGVGAVLGFLPQMMVLFICLAILENCGYMARIAFIMDRIFRRFGLSGKSFIPILIGTGCGVPGVMASRTIENEKDRRMTVMVTTFIPCSAKLPIIALIAGALFSNSSWIALITYFIGIGAILFSGIILKKTKLFAGEPAPFVMELPAYHRPLVKDVLKSMWDRSVAFVKRAGSIILVSAVVIWFLSSFNLHMQMVDIEDSMLASIGHTISIVFKPLGWGDWRASVATITGLVAKENVVATFGVLYSGIEVATENGSEIWGAVAASFTPVSGFSFLVFNMLCAPCFAAIGAIHREMGSVKWTALTVTYQIVLAYVAAFIVNQLGNFFVLHTSFGVGQVFAIIFILIGIWLLVRKGSASKEPTISSVEAMKKS